MYVIAAESWPYPLTPSDRVPDMVVADIQPSERLSRPVNHHNLFSRPNKIQYQRLSATKFSLDMSDPHLMEQSNGSEQ